ncbi:hypothetical protein [Moraxella lacunata]
MWVSRRYDKGGQSTLGKHRTHSKHSGVADIGRGFVKVGHGFSLIIL